MPITAEEENLELNVNFHSKHMENGTILAPGKMAVKLIPLSGAQQKQMQTTSISEDNGVTVPLQTQLNVILLSELQQEVNSPLLFFSQSIRMT